MFKQHGDRNVQGHFCMFNQALQVYFSLSEHQKHDSMSILCSPISQRTLFFVFCFEDSHPFARLSYW